MATSGSTGDEESSMDPDLDFLSVSFDPRKVLRTCPSKVVLPHPSVQPCDNLQAYTSVVQGRRQEPRPHAPPHPPGEQRECAEKKEKTKKKIKTVLDFMERDSPGPFSLLQRCRRAGGRVRIAIRHCTGVRGMCEGVLVVYDRHMNVVLGDVTEWCTPFRTVANGGITLSKNKRQRKKKFELSKRGNCEEQGGGVTEGVATQAPEETSETAGEVDQSSQKCSEETQKWEMTRTVKQLFIRGDNIIYITAANGATWNDPEQ